MTTIFGGLSVLSSVITRFLDHFLFRFTRASTLSLACDGRTWDPISSYKCVRMRPLDISNDVVDEPTFIFQNAIFFPCLIIMQ
jgi:hypothetical protein